MYDVIGDIHGHADALRRLLARLGYVQRDGCFRHAERQVIFLGDFIDRGPEIQGVLEIARTMVDGGAALAVMGNHEFNAVAFHLEHPEVPGTYLRQRNDKNIRQHRETLTQLPDQELVRGRAEVADGVVNVLAERLEPLPLASPARARDFR